MKKKPQAQEQRRERQRDACVQLLESWLPIATLQALANSDVKSTEPNREKALESGLKAGAFVLKLLERLARLDGLDAADKGDAPANELADPLELARRVQVVSPVLMARLRGRGGEDAETRGRGGEDAETRRRGDAERG